MGAVASEGSVRGRVHNPKMFRRSALASRMIVAGSRRRSAGECRKGLTNRAREKWRKVKQSSPCARLAMSQLTQFDKWDSATVSRLRQAAAGRKRCKPHEHSIVASPIDRRPKGKSLQSAVVILACNPISGCFARSPHACPAAMSPYLRRWGTTLAVYITFDADFRQAAAQHCGQPQRDPELKHEPP